MDQVLAQEKKRQRLRVVLFAIIMATLPCYCAGFLLWVTAPQQGAGSQQSLNTATATFTPFVLNTSTSGAPLVITPLPLTGTPFSPLQPTPGQFFPPAVTRYLSPTPFIFPTLTQAPTLTPFPTFAPPTETPFVAPTAAPPLPTETPIEVLPFPSDTPLPPMEIPTETPLGQ
ncbi:MAG: hypothetical protein KJ065_08630 [Anaerolineae bacterium]|nr:hypothetical protein [Anaerolineae bacterium]